MPPLDAAAAAAAVRKIADLEKALQRERERSIELERRAEALEEATRRAYKMVLTPSRPRDEDGR